MFQQEGAPMLTAISTQQFLELNMASVWPPYSPELNPLDYGI
jgi:hypothetical protein